MFEGNVMRCNDLSLVYNVDTFFSVTNSAIHCILRKRKFKFYQQVGIGETGRNLNVRLTEHKRATRNGDINNHIAEHHLQTNHRIDWDSAKCITYCTNYYQRLTLESWFTNLEQTPLNRCLQLPAPYKRLIDNNNETNKQ